MNPGESNAVITGIGQSQVGRRLMRSGLDLTAEAALAAIGHAGLSVEDIDGLSSWPGKLADNPGMSPVSVSEVKEALELRLNWFNAGMEPAGQLGGVFNAIMAVATGQARHVLCYRTLIESSIQGMARRGASHGSLDTRLGDHLQYLIPYGPSASNWTGVFAQRYCHDHGLTREQLGQVAVTLRANARKNPVAVYQEPLTLEDYLAARMISTPLCLYDCDVPIDGATAIIVSARDACGGLANPPLTVEAFSGAHREGDSWYQRPDLTTMAAHDAGAALWQRTRLTPADVDIAQVYDGFSIYVPMWLNALQLVAAKDTGAFLAEGGHSLAGRLPINTGGGQLSPGRLHGFGHLHEACVQLWGLGGERQVNKHLEVAAVGVGGGPLGGCMLLSRHN